MKPTRQTTFGRPDGNYWMACLCSLMEVDLELAPDLSGCTEPEHWDKWWTRSVDFCAEHGWALVMPMLGGGPAEVPLPAGWAIVGGPGPRGADHSCLAWNGEIVFDPHYSNDGLKKINDWHALIRLNPASVLSQIRNGGTS